MSPALKAKTHSLAALAPVYDSEVLGCVDVKKLNFST